jgi:hypothetical protein
MSEKRRAEWKFVVKRDDGSIVTCESTNANPYKLMGFVLKETGVAKKGAEKSGKIRHNLAEVVRRAINPPEGRIQEWMSIAWKVYKEAKRGWDEEFCVKVAKIFAREKGLPEDAAENLAKAIVENLKYIVGEEAEDEAGLQL